MAFNSHRDFFQVLEKEGEPGKGKEGSRLGRGSGGDRQEDL